MNISVFGAGYVGLVSAACYAEAGHHVSCLDTRTRLIDSLQRGECPLFEPGLPALLERNTREGRLHFVSVASPAVRDGEILVVAVNTPSLADGSADIRNVMDVTDAIGNAMTSYKCVVVKSTVPPGTCESVSARLDAILKMRGLTCDYDVASNPEFLRQGSAVADCLRPDRLVVGSNSSRSRNILERLYSTVIKRGCPFIAMDVVSAELTKYAANAMLATRISFMNELTHFCERLGADITHVRDGVAADRRIGGACLDAGLGYGGSCLPKDVSALIKGAEAFDENLTILRAVEAVNTKQRNAFVARVARAVGGNVSGKRIAIWGLAFKPDTCDVRDAPALHIMRGLLAHGAHLVAYDPVATQPAKLALGEVSSLTYVNDRYDALVGAQALCVLTAWDEFAASDLQRMKSLMETYTVIDGRNTYPPASFANVQGATYISVGRPCV